jgi:hypothetical protein
VDIISDKFTDDASVQLLESVEEAAIHLQACKDAVLAHVGQLKSLQASCGQLSSLSLFSAPTEIGLKPDVGESQATFDKRLATANASSLCPELRGFASDTISKCVEHVIMDSCVTLINQCLELKKMIDEKAKRRCVEPSERGALR